MEQKRFFILASASPRRRDYFERFGFSFKVKTPDIDEAVLPGESPVTYAMRLAEQKGKAIVEQCDQNELIFSADTIVSLSNQILGKPESAKDIRRMLQTLSGKQHTVVTAYMIYDCLDEKTILRHAISQVKFKHLSNSMIHWYSQLSEPLDKAGGYSIQGIGTLLVESIQGSFNNVVGLPIEMVIEDLVANQWVTF